MVVYSKNLIVLNYKIDKYEINVAYFGSSVTFDLTSTQVRKLILSLISRRELTPVIPLYVKSHQL